VLDYGSVCDFVKRHRLLNGVPSDDTVREPIGA